MNLQKTAQICFIIFMLLGAAVLVKMLNDKECYIVSSTKEECQELGCVCADPNRYMHGREPMPNFSGVNDGT